MKIMRTLLWAVVIVMLLPVMYLLVALVLSLITVNDEVLENTANREKTAHNSFITPHTIYLSTNGVHLDIVIPLKNISDNLQQGLIIKSPMNANDVEVYLSFGWGDEDFYLNVPTWGDLDTHVVINAMLLESSSLMHVTQYQHKHDDWVAIPVTTAQLNELNSYIEQAFVTDAAGQKFLLPEQGYGDFDNFYQATGSYSLKNTCNSWVNRGFKQSGLVASYWTPVDKGLLSKYQ